MLHLSSHDRYYFYNQTTDMRKGCYGLCGIVQNEMKKNILSGDVFVFINKRHNQIKLLQWDRDGFASVSYTHLDVYKRQVQGHLLLSCAGYAAHQAGTW